MRERRGTAPTPRTGLLCVVAALAAQWSVHEVDDGIPFAPLSLVNWFVAHTPETVGATAIAVLGGWALRLSLLVAVTGVVAVGTTAGRFGPRAVVVGSVLVSAGAAMIDPRLAGVAPILISAVVAGSAAEATRRLLAVSGHRAGRPGATDSGRRNLLVAVGGAWLLGVVGTSLYRRMSLAGLTAPVRADIGLGAVPTDPAFDAIPGLTRAVSTRASHYVVDIDLQPPVVDASSWRLAVDGAVDRSLSLSFDDLQAMPTVEQIATLSCISNPVGGDLIGNARWTGVRLGDVLGRAGIRPGATLLRADSADGYFDTVPLDRVMRPEVLIAIGMDGEVVPVEHGHPARLLVPGLYGMKNVKWLTHLTLLEDEGDGYWEARGWDTVADARTESRLDTPADGDHVSPALVAAGIAWAGIRRVSRVEVSIDDGRTWQRAQLEAELSPYGWRRWKIGLHLDAGSHPITVRAFDGAGVPEDSEHRDPHPAGASGYHRITVRV